VLLVVAFAIVLAIPAVQQNIFLHYATDILKTRGARLECSGVEGSLWAGGFELLTPMVICPVANIGDVDARFDRARISLNLTKLRSENGSPVPSMEFDGGNVAIRFHAPTGTNPAGAGEFRQPTAIAIRRLIPASHLLPERLILHDVSMTLTTPAGALSAESVTIDAGADDGVASIRGFDLRLGNGHAAVENLNGTSTWRDAVLAIHNVTLASDTIIRDAEIDLSHVGENRLSCGLNLQGFGGIARGGLRLMSENVNTVVEASGSLAGIDVEEFARFFGRKGAFSGKIESARYSYRGDAADLENATAAVRMKAGNFRWRDKQWDSLILGATLSRQRIQVQSLQLLQPGNRIDFSGESDIPKDLLGGNPPKFTCKVEAEVDNLKSLFGLLTIPGPAVNGRFTASGDIANESGTPSGKIEIKGSQLKIDKARIAEASATLVVNGPEFTLEKVAIRNGKDVIEGSATFAVAPLRTYKGNFRCKIASLDAYRSALGWWNQLPDGGENIEARWSGDGTPTSNSGAFSASVRNLKGLADLPTLSGDISGTYSPEFLYLDSFELSREFISIKARLAVSPDGLRLDDISYSSHGKERLRGYVTLPIKPGKLAAPLGPGLIINPTGKLEGSVRLTELRTSTLGNLLGVAADDIEGVLTGTLAVQGTASKPVWTGSIDVADGRLVGNAKRPLIEEFSGSALASASASFTIPQARATIAPFGPCSLSGSISAVPGVPLQISADLSSNTELELVLPILRAAIKPQLILAGSPGNIGVTGTITPIHAAARLTPKLLPVAKNSKGDTASPHSEIDLAKILPAANRFDVTVIGDCQNFIGYEPTSLKVSLHLSGSMPNPALDGMLFANGKLGEGPLAIDSIGAIWKSSIQAPSIFGTVRLGNEIGSFHGISNNLALSLTSEALNTVEGGADAGSWTLDWNAP
jgi:hypothetical protein